MVFLWSLRSSKSPQFSRTLLSILANLNSVVVWMASTRPHISKSSCPFNNPSVTVPRAPITININVTFMFHSFFNSRARSQYLFSLSFNFTLWSSGTSKSTILWVLFLFFSFFFFLLLLSIKISCRLAEIRWSVCTLKSHIIIINNNNTLPE